MADRHTSDAWEPRTFKYVDVDNKSYRNCVDITVETGLKPISIKKIRLPRKLIKKRLIMIHQNDKEVTIPAWLCAEQGLE